MSLPMPPSDATSLLVPIHLDAWVVDAENQEDVSWYLADYTRLARFLGPMPEPFEPSGEARPTVGVHLHWALPDALTHGRQETDGGEVVFPLVPNRWLVLRFAPATATARPAKAWLVRSDALSTPDGAGRKGANQGSSAFLDPHRTTTMTVGPEGKTTFAIHPALIGTHEPLGPPADHSDNEGGALFLQAVGPANPIFAAYAPQVRDVFSFVDTDLPPNGTDSATFTYLVVGWYSDPAAADPLRGVEQYVPGVFASPAVWEALTPAQRFEAVLADASWSVEGAVPASPPTTCLYHALVSGVRWPYTTLGHAGIDTDRVQVVVGNTTADALAALIRALGKKESDENPADSGAWLAAGDTLAELVVAAHLDLLPELAEPAGPARLQQAVHRSWFGSAPGGTDWEVVAAVPDQAPIGSSAPPRPVLTPDQDAALRRQLAALNRSQRELDEAERALDALREDLYMLWWRVARVGSFAWGEDPTTQPPWSILGPYLTQRRYPALMSEVLEQATRVSEARAALPPATDPAAAARWADTQWRFPVAGGTSATLSALGLALKPAAAPRFWHPVDPVVLVAGLKRSRKHGEDGRYNPDGTLRCRLPGQTVSGLTVPKQPPVDVAALRAAGIDPGAAPSSSATPSLENLACESFFQDPATAATIATALGGDATAIGAAITALAAGEQTGATWVGSAPTPFAMGAWQQAWAPLFLEWDVDYFPTGTGAGQSHRFQLSDWHFDGSELTWKGTGFDEDYVLGMTGRTFLTPHAALHFRDKLAKYLRQHDASQAARAQQLLDQVAGWDVLSQSLGGLLDRLLTRRLEATFAPPPAPASPGQPARPPVTELIGDAYHALPVLDGDGSDVRTFYPIRGGFAGFRRLRVVDAFGQTLALTTPNTPQGFQPLLGQGLEPTNPPTGFPVGLVQLPPRIVQPSRLELDLLANDGSGAPAREASNDNPICGWLLPNHLDGALAVYDAAGTLLGELVPRPPPDGWRPRPGLPGAHPPPERPADIANPVLRAVVLSLAAQPPAVLEDVLEAVDETLWMVDPLGGRRDQALSVLLGRPLAVVQARARLRVQGPLAHDHTWDRTLAHTPPYAPKPDHGEIATVAFPVRLGDLQLRDDGLIGYFLDGTGADSPLYVTHAPNGAGPGDTFVKPILVPDGEGGTRFQGGLFLEPQGDGVTLTLIVDPRGRVHGTTGLLPTVSVALPPHRVETFLGQLQATFRTGPVLAATGTLRLPKPAEDRGTWTWVQRVAATPGWIESGFVSATDRARFSADPLELREGWLMLADLKDDG